MDNCVDLKEYLYEILYENGPMTRKELVEITKVPRTTIYDNLAKLILEDKIVKLPKKKRKPGRPNVLFKAL